jgi:competence protein ComEA
VSAGPTARFDFAWRRVHLPAMLLVLAVAGGALAVRVVSRPIAFGPEAPVDSAKVEAAEEKLDPNTASVASLRRLPGIGPVKARAIVAYRGVRRGSAFAAAEDLMAVHGIGPATVRRIEPYLSLPAAAY